MTDGGQKPRWRQADKGNPRQLNGRWAWNRVAQVAKEAVGLLLFLEDPSNQEPEIEKPHDQDQPDSTTKNTECI